MKRTAFWLIALVVPAVVCAANELTVTADRIVADRTTQALVASGHVVAVSHPYRLLTSELSRDADGTVKLSDPTTVTTCTNALCQLHWRVTGDVQVNTEEYLLLQNLWVHLYEFPVLWLPYWYYPLDTDYGLRYMIGHRSRWGAYIMTKYVYHLAGDPSGEEGSVGLRAASRFDLRYHNGIALGQSLRWKLGDFGDGHIKGYYAWDRDYDRYDRHWTSKKWNYQNWGSTVPRERYSVDFRHVWEMTERDQMRVKGAVYSDSYFTRDFLEDRLFNLRNPFTSTSANEWAWERHESLFGAGMSVSGPLNDFVGGVARLPEFYFDVMPQPLWGSPVNYESQTLVGYYNRSPARNGRKTGNVTAFNYNPGPWAEYNTGRIDTYHRLTLPFKMWDALSVVPRGAYHATYWGESGQTVLDGTTRAGETGHDLFRSIFEGGITFSGRGSAWIDDQWQHVIEPYADILLQEADYTGNEFGDRPYVFDGIDTSNTWEDQFAGRSRNLPYSWYGITPGLRNAWRKADEKGVLRTVLDVDVYAAVQFNEGEWTTGNRYHRLPELGKPFTGSDSPFVVPGVRFRWAADKDLSLSGRVEYDTDRDRMASSQFQMSHQLTPSFSYSAKLIQRSHRYWDYSSTLYKPSMESDDFNWAHYSFFEISFEQELCDAVAWSPFCVLDCREGELEDAGVWIDYRTDCLGFRFMVSYSHDYTRIDGSEYKNDWASGFYIYLREIGPDMGSIFSEE